MGDGAWLVTDGRGLSKRSPKMTLTHSAIGKKGNVPFYSAYREYKVCAIRKKQ